MGGGVGVPGSAARIEPFSGIAELRIVGNGDPDGAFFFFDTPFESFVSSWLTESNSGKLLEVAMIQAGIALLVESGVD
uniref:Uncharacterized protein n=1 Tax=Oscillatoriales cyanobacterium SpSt-402 TaxID=2282168 RepID=A0A832H0U3_9CYAN